MVHEPVSRAVQTGATGAAQESIARPMLGIAEQLAGGTRSSVGANMNGERLAQLAQATITAIELL